MKPKLLISSCLLGEKVKYNGKDNKLSINTLDKLAKTYEIISFCPEVQGGLPTPRIPCEVISLNPLRVINKNQEDKTKEFVLGANKTLDLCKQENISIALLKANSPSCSSKYIYDGTFTSKKIESVGITTSLLLKNNIKVFDETHINELI